MDEITEKRIENDVKKLGNLGGHFLSTMMNQMSALTAADLPALIERQQKLQPAWASGLTDIANLLVGFAYGRLRRFGASGEHLMAILVAAIDESAEPVWPMGGCATPAWVVVPTECESCGTSEHGGVVDMARQCVKALVFAYREFESIAIVELDASAARARAFEQIQFQAVITQAVLPPL